MTTVTRAIRVLVCGRTTEPLRPGRPGSALPGIEVVAAVGSGVEGVRLTHALCPDVVLVGPHLTGMAGAELVRRVTRPPAPAGVRALMLTAATDDEVLAALNSGASGIVESDAGPDVVAAAIRTVARGEAYLAPSAARLVLDTLFPLEPPRRDAALEELIADLTPREREVVSLAALGLDNKAISQRLTVSHLTVKTHISRAMVKLDVRSRAQLVATAHRGRITTPAPPAPPQWRG
ncbi:response regulator transcription factor [Streptomyces sp. NPDC048290]|uniref:response regulator transcription factor n=1 Tax=Streptomyces sp. NPDC048290 TaxID=3155811 RepID=UPI0034373DA4